MNSTQPKTKTNPSKQLHASRSAKKLVGKLERLSRGSVTILCQYLVKRIDQPESVILLTSLLTGWSVKSLLENKNVLFFREDTNEYFLISPWKYPPPQISPDISKWTFEPVNCGLIPLPLELGRLLKKTIGDNRQWNIIEKSIQTHLADILADSHTGFTLSRVANILWYLGTNYELSPFECRYISGQPFKKHSQNSYVSFDVGAVWEKLYKYWDSLLPGIQWHNPEPIFQYFGSQRAFRPSDVKFLMLQHQERTLEALISSNQQLFFNRYTHYVIDLLQLVTLCRPGNAIFGSIDNFRKDFSLCYIQDKGKKSDRLIPIAPSVRPVLTRYLNFLKTLSKDTCFSDSSVSKALQSVLNGKTNLFQQWGCKGLSPVKIGPYESNFYGFKCHTNWHRHTILSAFFQDGLCVNALPAFADHQPEFEHNFSDTSSIEFNHLVEVSEQINTFLQRWQIPLLQPRF